MPRSVSPAPKPGVVKHRACDECRSRKLACSKELDGCSRCRREGMRCVYSPQKPMGRPRKRRNADSPKEKSMDSPAQNPADAGSSHQHDHVQGYPLDADFSYYTGDAYHSAGLMDYMTQSYSMGPATSHPSMPIDPSLDSSAYQSNLDGQFQFGGLDILGGIGFDDEPDPQEMQMTREYVHRVFGVMPDESTPPPASRSHSHTPEPNQSLKSLPSAQCQCLSNLYLGLDALANLPTEPFAAIRVARRGSKIAYDVVNCLSCSIPLIRDPLAPPPMESFQNMMLLGAIIPSTCNAYSRILEMINKIVNEAQREKQKLHFSFRQLGGLWGKLAEVENACNVALSVNDKDLSPDAWRTAIRATLRADIYGLTFKPESGDVFSSNPRPFQHPGLKQVVRLLEERSRIRHKKIEELADQGRHCSHAFGKPLAGGEQGENSHQCLKIIEGARIALDRLVIA